MALTYGSDTDFSPKATVIYIQLSNRTDINVLVYVNIEVGSENYA